MITLHYKIKNSCNFPVSKTARTAKLFTILFIIIIIGKKKKKKSKSIKNKQPNQNQNPNPNRAGYSILSQALKLPTRPCNLFVPAPSGAAARPAPARSFTRFHRILRPRLSGRGGAGPRSPGALCLPRQPREAQRSPLPAPAEQPAAGTEPPPPHRPAWRCALREGRTDPPVAPLQRPGMATPPAARGRLPPPSPARPRTPIPVRASRGAGRPLSPFTPGTRTPPLLCSPPSRHSCRLRGGAAPGPAAAAGGRRNRHLCGVAPTYRLTKPQPAAGREGGREGASERAGGRAGGRRGTAAPGAAALPPPPCLAGEGCPGHPPPGLCRRFGWGAVLASCFSPKRSGALETRGGLAGKRCSGGS